MIRSFRRVLLAGLLLGLSAALALILVGCGDDSDSGATAAAAQTAAPTAAPSTPAPEPEPEPTVAPDPATPTPDPEPTAQPEPTVEAESEPEAMAEPELELLAGELFAEFQEDEDGARAKYIGKTARITGVILEQFFIGRGGFFMIAGEGESNGVICNLGAEAYEAVKDRQVGEQMTITGTIADILYDVAITDCVVEG